MLPAVVCAPNFKTVSAPMADSTVIEICKDSAPHVHLHNDILV